MKSRAICLIGSLENLGDAFIAQAQSQYLSRSGRFPGGICIAAWRHAGVQVTAGLTDDTISVAPIAPNPLRFLRRCIAADVFLGGGNMLRPDTSLAWLLVVTLGLATARLTGGRVSVVGAGAVRMPQRSRRLLWSGLLALASRIQLRDERSASNTRLDHPRLAGAVSVTGDAAFVAILPRVSVPADGGTCLIAPGQDPSVSRTVDADLLVEIVRALIAQRRLQKVLLVAHDPRTELDGDLCERLGKRLRKEFAVNVAVVRPRDTCELLFQYRGAAVVVTNRLHSLIVSALHGLPVLCLHDVTEKMIPFARALGYPGTASNWSQKSRFEVAAMVANLKNFDPHSLLHSVDRCRESARRNFAL